MANGILYVDARGNKFVGVTYKDGNKGTVTKLDPVFGGSPKLFHHSNPKDKEKLSNYKRMSRAKSIHDEL